MGYLQYGAMAGAGKEFLKQSAETRQAGFQEIRDKRLSELKKEEQTHASGLVEKQQAASYEREKGDYTAGYGEDVYRDGALVAEGRERPTSTSTTQRGNLITMVSGDQRTYEELRKSWEGIAHAKDEFGNEIRVSGVPEWDDWFNQRVAPQHRINPRTGEPEPTAEPSTASYDQAREEASDQAGWLSSDKSDFGPEGKQAWIDKRAREIEAEGKKPALGEGKPKASGMLSETEKPKKAVKVKTPLTQSAKQDPVQMYDELNAQGFGDQDIIDTIRLYFQDPLWEIPPNALQ